MKRHRKLELDSVISIRGVASAWLVGGIRLGLFRELQWYDSSELWFFINQSKTAGNLSDFKAFHWAAQHFIVSFRELCVRQPSTLQERHTKLDSDAAIQKDMHGHVK